MKSGFLYIVFILGILLLFSGQSYGCGGGYCPPCEPECPQCRICVCGSCVNRADGSACGTKWTCTICEGGSCVSSCESGERCCEGDPEEVCTGYCCYDADEDQTCRNHHCCCLPNGCGACRGEDYDDNPTGCAGTDFEAACNGHDSCYGTCADGDEDHKGDCDYDFLLTMRVICNSSSCKSPCLLDAYLYAAAVAFVGDDGYDAAQACSCDD